MNNFNFFDENLPKNGFWGRNFKIVSPDSESASLKYYAHQFSGKTINFEFLDPNFRKNGFWGRDYKNWNLNLVEMNTSKIPCVPIFSQNG